MIIVGTHMDLYNKLYKKKKKKGNFLFPNFVKTKINKCVTIIIDSVVAQNPLVEMLEGIKRRYRRRFPDVVDVMAVSCKSKKGVRELQQRIVEAAEKKRYVGQEVPPTWVILSRHIIHMQTKQPPLMVPLCPGPPPT